MPPTSTKVKARQAAREKLEKRKEKLDAEQRLRDIRETDLAADFLISQGDRDAARRAQQEAEIAMGKAVDCLITELNLRYSRLAELLDQPEVELKRLRQAVLEQRSTTKLDAP
jgi:hypothetical protein